MHTHTQPDTYTHTHTHRVEHAIAFEMKQKFNETWQGAGGGKLSKSAPAAWLLDWLAG